MKKSNFKWIMFTILLGALGSGLWDLALKAWFSSIWNLSLTIVTLGTDSLKNAIYADVAKGFYERPALMVHTMIIGSLAAVTITLLLSKNSSSKTEPSQKIASSDKKITLVAKLVTVFAVVVLLFEISKAFYINRAIGYYEQLSSICAPYLTKKEQVHHRSRFAQMESTAEYKILIDDLIEIARINNQRVPEFEPFD